MLNLVQMKRRDLSVVRQVKLERCLLLQLAQYLPACRFVRNRMTRHLAGLVESEQPVKESKVNPENLRPD